MDDRAAWMSSVVGTDEGGCCPYCPVEPITTEVSFAIQIAVLSTVSFGAKVFPDLLGLDTR